MPLFKSAPRTKGISVNPSSHQELLELFTAYEYDWERMNEGIPPLVVKSLPEDLNQIRDLQKKKKVFFLSILPITLLANQKIQLQREELKDIFKKIGLGETLSPVESDFLDATLKTYKLSGDPVNDVKLRRELLKRVDIVPTGSGSCTSGQRVGLRHIQVLASGQ